jgi:Ca-activated chloride channel family protein
MRAVRPAGIALGTLLLVALGAAVPLASRGAEWLSVRWDQPWWLLLLAVVPLLVYSSTLRAEARAPRLRVPSLAPLATGPRGLRARLRDTPGMLRGAALVFAALALARPQNLQRLDTAEELGIDIAIVLDMSGSMRAVMDGEAPAQAQPARGKRPTRLATAKDVILDFIARRKTDRIGVVVFGKNAYVLSPPTLDYSLLASLVQRMEIDLIDGNGTAIGDAVGVGVARLRRSPARSKVLILLTDGDSNAGSVSPEYATELAKKLGVRIYTVQIGNGDDVEVEDGTDLFGQPRYVRRRYPVNPALLHKMAADTGAESFVATDRVGLEKSMHTILDRLEKTRIEAAETTTEELFPMLLVPAALLVILEVLARVLFVRRFP